MKQTGVQMTESLKTGATVSVEAIVVSVSNRIGRIISGQVFAIRNTIGIVPSGADIVEVRSLMNQSTRLGIHNTVGSSHLPEHCANVDGSGGISGVHVSIGVSTARRSRTIHRICSAHEVVNTVKTISNSTVAPVVACSEPSNVKGLGRGASRTSKVTVTSIGSTDSIVSTCLDLRGLIRSAVGFWTGTTKKPSGVEFWPNERT
jgi:hypothetical protein